MKSNFKWIVVLGIFCIVCLLVWFARENGTKGKIAEIKQGDTVIKTIDLSKIVEPYQEKISDGHGGYNIIRVENGRIAVIEADCPDKVCVQQGYIDSGAYPIVCLPHKLSVTIKDNDKKIDAVVGGK